MSSTINRVHCRSVRCWDFPAGFFTGLNFQHFLFRFRRSRDFHEIERQLSKSKRDDLILTTQLTYTLVSAIPMHRARLEIEDMNQSSRDIAIACRASQILSFNPTRSPRRRCKTLYILAAVRTLLPFLLIEHSTTGGIHDLAAY